MHEDTDTVLIVVRTLVEDPIHMQLLFDRMSNFCSQVGRRRRGASRCPCWQHGRGQWYTVASGEVDGVLKRSVPCTCSILSLLGWLVKAQAAGGKSGPASSKLSLVAPVGCPEGKEALMGRLNYSVDATALGVGYGLCRREERWLCPGLVVPVHPSVRPLLIQNRPSVSFVNILFFLRQKYECQFPSSA